MRRLTASHAHWFSGDGDLAVYARRDRSADVSVAPDGDLVVVDRPSSRIRIITKEG